MRSLQTNLEIKQRGLASGFWLLALGAAGTTCEALTRTVSGPELNLSEDAGVEGKRRKGDPRRHWCVLGLMVKRSAPAFCEPGRYSYSKPCQLIIIIIIIGFALAMEGLEDGHGHGYTTVGMFAWFGRLSHFCSSAPFFSRSPTC